ncbi:hypothetical protein B7486_59195, partial [cyanobacterium TDX16]
MGAGRRGLRDPRRGHRLGARRLSAPGRQHPHPGAAQGQGRAQRHQPRPHLHRRAAHRHLGPSRRRLRDPGLRGHVGPGDRSRARDPARRPLPRRER